MSKAINFTPEHIEINGHFYPRLLIEKIILLASHPDIENIAVDGFSGMGGVTEGWSRLNNWMVIACINHWPVAIETHEKNHPDCLHLLEDFRTADIAIIKYMIDEIKKANPAVNVHCWFSLECTNFSNAKGGMSRDADSRTLAEHTDRYIIDLSPDRVWIENVREFQLWGPMVVKVISIVNGKKKTQYVPQGTDSITFYNKLIDEGHKLICPLDIKKKQNYIGPWMIPCPYTKGQDFKRWRDYTCSLGYTLESKLMNCADFGVPQHRIRLIMQFCAPGIGHDWPSVTHDKKGAHGLPPWLPVGPCLDLDDEGKSVLSFKLQKGKLVPRIKSAKTVDRLIKGCDRRVIGEQNKDQAFIVKYISNNQKTGSNAGAPLTSASPVITCQNRLALAKIHMLDYYFGNGYTKPITDPAGVAGTKDGIALHSVQYLSTYHSQGDGSPINRLSPAIMTKDKYPLVSAHFIDMQHSQGQQNKGIDEASSALLGVPKQKMVSVERFIMDTQFNNGSHSIDETARTQTASRKHFYLVNFQWFNGNLRTIDKECNTIIARLDKAPNYLITIETGELAIAVFENDPPHYVKLKKYMAENGIIAINMRMLKEKELLKIMSASPDQQLSDSSTDNKKMIGNMVPPDLVEKIGAACRPKQTNSIAV